MKRPFLVLMTVVAMVAASLPMAAQTFQPRSIHFTGDPEYSDQELLAASGLKAGEVLSSAALHEHSQRLMDSGVFDSLTFKFDEGDLVYSLAPATALCPIRLENLPLTQARNLVAELHDRLPLFHGKVPAEGGLNEDVRKALEELLAAQGIKATVMATAAANTGLHKVMAISYAIVAPPVEVGEIHLDSASVAPDRGVMEILAKLTGSAYDTEGSPSQISTYLGNYYHDNGYLEADIHATAENAPSIAPEAIRIPFLISIAPGALYRLSGVQLADSLAVTQADFDRQSLIHPGEIAGGQRLVEEWEFVARQYHNKGYLKASIHPTPSYDRAHGTVAFAVTVEPGPVYTMGKLTLENVSDDLRAMILAAWKMPPGAVFNEGAIRGFFATVGVNPALERVFKTINIKYSMRLNDDTKTVDVALRLERKP